MSHAEALNNLMGKACDSLPPGYEIRLTLTCIEADLSLLDENEEVVDVCTDDMDCFEKIEAYIRHARNLAGMDG